MGQGKSKQGGGNGQKASGEPKGLADLLNKDEFYKEFEGVTKFNDFYHAFYMVIEKLNKEGGAMEIGLPTKKELEKSFNNYCKPGREMKKDEFKKIITDVIKLERFSMGKGALDVIMFLFGIPIITVLAKRVIPGSNSISDDVVIPIATAGTVFVLAKTHKL